MTSPFKLRAAELSDLDRIFALEQASDPHPWSLSLVEDALHNRQNWLLECCESGQVLGWLTASLLFDQSELELVVTDHNKRRQGLGSCLLQHWLSWALEQGCEEGLLEVRESNLGAIALYRQLGFEQVGLRKNYYPLAEGGSEAAVLMTCKLR